MISMPCIDMQATGQRIRQLRINAGMTIKDIQDACGITSTSVCNWQKGKALPSVDNLMVLAWLWNVKIDDILVCSVC